MFSFPRPRSPISRLLAIAVPVALAMPVVTFLCSPSTTGPAPQKTSEPISLRNRSVIVLKSESRIVDWNAAELRQHFDKSRTNGN